MKIQCLARGYYDQNNENVALIAENAVLTVSKERFPAPCKSKAGKGKWAIGLCENSRKNVIVFMEDGNYRILNNENEDVAE
jgi:hypothetical protein